MIKQTIKPTTFYIVRHGESKGNADRKVFAASLDTKLGSDLTELGVSQARRLAKDFEKIHFDLVFSSQLLRAQRTAEILSLEKKLAVTATEILRERSRGKIKGELESELAGEFKSIFDAMELMPIDRINELKSTYGIETRNEAVSRVFTFLRELALGNQGKTILIVCHAGMMRGLLIHLGFGSGLELVSGSIKNTGYFVLESDGVDFRIVDTKDVYKKDLTSKKTTEKNKEE